MSHSPAFTAMIAVRNAVAPVAHALATLYTGIPVWPICFCNVWPMLPGPPIKLPAARMPMSRIVTPPSASAPIAASLARSIVSLSGCLPNLVMWIPRIQMSSAAIACSFLHWFESEPDRIGAGTVGTDHLGRQPDLHSDVNVFGVGLDVDDVGAHARSLAVDQAGDVRDRDPGRRERHDREGAQLAGRRARHLAKLGCEAIRAGIPAVEVARAARGALVRHELRLGLERQVLDQRDLLCHS